MEIEIKNYREISQEEFNRNKGWMYGLKVIDTGIHNVKEETHYFRRIKKSIENKIDFDVLK